MKRIILGTVLSMASFAVLGQDPNVLIGLNAPGYGVKLKMNFPGYNGGWARGFSLSNETESTNFITFGAMGSTNNGVSSLSYGYIGKDYNDTFMVFNPNGNIGMGTIAPSEDLHIESNDRTVLKLKTNSTTDDLGIWFQGKRANSTVYSSHYIGVDGDSHYNLRIDADEALKLQTNGTDKMVISSNGNVGIGTSVPEQKLDVVDGSIQSRSTVNGRKIKLDAVNGNIELTGNATVLQINRFSTNNMALATGGGNVAIGTLLAPTGYKLAVAGKTITEEVKVQLQTNWPDYVFEKNYELPSLAEVEQHIKEKGHLENIPSAEEVKKDGFFLGAMDAKLLQKIEELTLYTIQQEKEIQKLKARNTEIETVKKQNEALQEKLNKLEKLVQKLL